MSGYSAYQRTQIATADRRKIIVLLYEGAITRLTQSMAAIRDNDPDRRVLNANKALDIIHFLTNGLDFERGGEIARNLERLYDYVRDIIAAGNIHSDTSKFTEAIRLLTILLEAWRQICNGGADTPPDLVERRAREAVASVASVG
jgi:flagellar protein FliS